MILTQGSSVLFLCYSDCIDDLLDSDTCLDFSPELQSYLSNSTWSLIKLKISKVVPRVFLCKMCFSFWVPRSAIHLSLSQKYGLLFDPETVYVLLNQHPAYLIILFLHVLSHHFNLRDHSHCFGHSSTSQVISLHVVQFFFITRILLNPPFYHVSLLMKYLSVIQVLCDLTSSHILLSSPLSVQFIGETCPPILVCQMLYFNPLPNDGSTLRYQSCHIFA